MVWIKYTVGQNTSKYFERLLAFKECDQNHLTLSTSFFNFPFEEIFSYKKKKKIARPSFEYREAKCRRDDFIS